MPDLLAVYESSQFVVYQGSDLFARLVFDHGLLSATIFIGEDEYRAEPESADEKDIVMRKNGVTLFKFKFDYVWGGAELQIEGEDTGYEVTGKWFKPGTRFVDEHSNDLIVVVSDESIPPKINIDVVSPEEATPLMIMATLYYHIYTSASKRFITVLGGIV